MQRAISRDQSFWASERGEKALLREPTGDPQTGRSKVELTPSPQSWQWVTKAHQAGGTPGRWAEELAGMGQAYPVTLASVPSAEERPFLAVVEDTVT